METIDLPENIQNMDLETITLIKEYINQFNECEKKAYQIASLHLGTSFNILKSNGYKDWLKKNQSNK
jgi:hypothetical protein